MKSFYIAFSGKEKVVFFGFMLCTLFFYIVAVWLYPDMGFNWLVIMLVGLGVQGIGYALSPKEFLEQCNGNKTIKLSNLSERLIDLSWIIVFCGFVVSFIEEVIIK